MGGVTKLIQDGHKMRRRMINNGHEMTQDGPKMNSRMPLLANLGAILAHRGSNRLPPGQ